MCFTSRFSFPAISICFFFISGDESVFLIISQTQFVSCFIHKMSLFYFIGLKAVIQCFVCFFFINKPTEFRDAAYLISCYDPLHSVWVPQLVLTVLHRWLHKMPQNYPVYVYEVLSDLTQKASRIRAVLHFQSCFSHLMENPIIVFIHNQ
jgi:hypothetical protein